MLNFDSDIGSLKGVGERRAEALRDMGIDTVGALLRFYPRAYEDWSNIIHIFDCEVQSQVCIKARLITPIKEQYIRKNMTLYKFVVSDETGRMPITIFNNRYLARSLREGREYLFFGKVSGDGFLPSMTSPEIRTVGTEGIKPVYRAGGGITSKTIEKLVKTALFCDFGDDPLPPEILSRYKLCGFEAAISDIHFPKSRQALDAARRRLVFEELFVLQTALALLKGKRRRDNNFRVLPSAADGFCKLLPYELTNAQKRAVSDCISDMSSGKTMNRLVQGDVGSGKTAVSAAVMYAAVRSGFQSALMAPTELLAEQHFATLSKIFDRCGINCRLITGSTPKKERAQTIQALASGECNIAVGTHALFSNDVEFSALGLVITDEQHRFGVAQRAALSAKGQNPHTLVMSATPIPRTLALIIYGDLDISIINEYPHGRQCIESYVVPGALRARAFNYIKKHLDEGRQGYIVCPMIEESEDLPVAAAVEYYKKIKEKDFKEYRVGLLHGKLGAAEKEDVMLRFKSGEIQLLVCTTVIEVGIDVPNAVIMLIENAERFGLSQLHQLRGRVGRGEYKSTCIFMSDSDAERLAVIKSTGDGFKIADEDLRLRGPGDFLGRRQHGLPELKIADFAADAETMRISGIAASQILKADPRLQGEEHLPLKRAIAKLYKKLNEN